MGHSFICVFAFYPIDSLLVDNISGYAVFTSVGLGTLVTAEFDNTSLLIALLVVVTQLEKFAVNKHTVLLFIFILQSFLRSIRDKACNLEYKYNGIMKLKILNCYRSKCKLVNPAKI